MEQDLAMYVIYKQPLDYPHSYVLQRHRITPDGGVPDPLPMAIAVVTDPNALMFVRLAIPLGLARIQGPGDDPDPCIHEVWV